MVKISDLKTASQVEEEARTDKEVRRELDRTALANAVAIEVIRYRADHGLSQTQLARKLEMHQSAIARLEAGDHEPSLSTLARLARELDIAFDIRITPEGVKLNSGAPERPTTETAPDFWLFTVAHAEAAMAAQRTCRELLASKLLLWTQSHLSQSHLASEKKSLWIAYSLQLQERLTTLQEDEETDRMILAEFEQLLREEYADHVGEPDESIAPDLQ
jgi:transcriptional regulator with XRE-family HTH domain